MKHNEKKLPKWVQKRLEDLRWEIQQLTHSMDELKKAHAVLIDREWQTIPGPTKYDEQDYYHLFTLHPNGAHPICSVGRRTILLIGYPVIKKNLTTEKEMT